MHPKIHSGIDAKIVAKYAAMHAPARMLRGTPANAKQAAMQVDITTGLPRAQVKAHVAVTKKAASFVKPAQLQSVSKAMPWARERQVATQFE